MRLVLDEPVNAKSSYAPSGTLIYSDMHVRRRAAALEEQATAP